MVKATKPIPKLDGPCQVVRRDGGPMGPMHYVMLAGVCLGATGGGEDNGLGRAMDRARDINLGAKAGAADAEQRLKNMAEEVKMCAEGLERDLRLSEDPLHPLSRDTLANRAGTLRAAISRSMT